ncbi:thermonuclease family protein, partial [Blastomonas sp.]|uniref:thermonuclease family protein n=1 Tax=Blastomonas sp. TaxID=1909299 RepID=UPI0035934357
MSFHRRTRSPRPTSRAVGLALALAALIGWSAPDWLPGATASTFNILDVPAGDLMDASDAADRQDVQFGLCSQWGRVACVVDGDTFWLKGEKIRIADIDTPEISSPRCPGELERGRRATERMLDLLNAAPFALEPVDRSHDRYGRALFRVTRAGESLGDVLIDEGLAVRFGGGKPDWC